MIDDTTVLDYPGPIYYEEDLLRRSSAWSLVLHREGSIKYEGEIWLVDRPRCDASDDHADNAMGNLGLCPTAP